VGRIADEFAISKVHDKIEMFQWNLPDEDGNFIRDFGYIDDAIAALDGQSNGVLSIIAQSSGQKNGGQ